MAAGPVGTEGVDGVVDDGDGLGAVRAGGIAAFTDKSTLGRLGGAAPQDGSGRLWPNDGALARIEEGPRGAEAKPLGPEGGAKLSCLFAVAVWGRMGERMGAVRFLLPPGPVGARSVAEGPRGGDRGG